MTDPEQNDSISALSTCMTMLNTPRKLGCTYTASARIRYADSHVLQGKIQVGFILRDTANGPEIDCDPDIMMEYGASHGNFRPWFQRFCFDAPSLELRISNDNPARMYDFTLCFVR